MPRTVKYDCNPEGIKINGLSYHTGQLCARCDSYLLGQAMFKHCPECGAPLMYVPATPEIDS